MRRAALVTTAAAAVMVAATACSGHPNPPRNGPHAESQDQAQAGHVVQAAYAKTVGAGSAKVSLDTTIKVKGRTLHFTGHGVESFASRAADLTVTIPQTGGRIESRYLAGHLYEKLPPAAASKLGGKPWISIDLNRVLKRKYGATVQQLEQNAPGNPGDALGYLRAVSAGGVTTVGTEKVHGVPATHYKATVDLDKAAAGQQPAARRATQKLEQRLGVHNLPIELWVDRRGRLAQLKLTEHLAKPQGSNGGSIGPLTTTTTIGLSDFGTPVHIAPPPPAEISNFTSTLGG